MKTFMARLMLVGVIGLGVSGSAAASGDCGMNSNQPCPPPKSSAKEPAYQNLNRNKPAAQQVAAEPARTDVQAKEGEEPAARATLSGVSASDLKKPPAGDCGMNSNTPCADATAASAPDRVQSGDNGAAAARATLSGVNPNDLKVKPKAPKTSEKEPAANP